MVKGIGFGILVVGLALTVASCGSSGSSGGTSGTTSSADSLSDLPATSTLVSGGGASASLSAKSVGKAATGTPPLLKGISASNVDSYFWNGLLATITAAGTATSAQITDFWEGEGACRMAQTVGYAFQNVLQGGTSLCYMQNMPKSANGVTVTSGTATASTVLDQGASNKVIKVSIVDSFGSFGQDIFIKVYGTSSSEGSSGFAADMWFCTSGSSNGTEQIRVNNSANTFTTTSVHKDFGNFVGQVTASLTTNSSGQFIFDTSKDRVADVYFGPTDGSFTFLGNVTIDKNKLITARDYQTGSFSGNSQTSKKAIFANYTGDTMDELRFSAAGYALSGSFGGSSQVLSGATEFSTSKYVAATSGDLLTSGRNEAYTANIYTGTSSTFYSSAQTLLSAVSSNSCTTTPDVVVSMDFTASGPKAVASTCENHFADMNFCDGSAVQAARTIVFQSQAGQGSCSTTFCPYELVDGVNTGTFACQKWADNNLGNAQGITTANATCSTAGCCAKQ